MIKTYQTLDEQIRKDLSPNRCNVKAALENLTKLKQLEAQPCLTHFRESVALLSALSKAKRSCASAQANIEVTDAIIGRWTYCVQPRDGRCSFKDTHTIERNGKVEAPGNTGTWSFKGQQLKIVWPNGWKNVYLVQGTDLKALTGITLDPNGGAGLPSMLTR